MDLVTFLAARYDEDEEQAKGPPGWKPEHWTAVRYADKDSGRNWRVDAEPRCVVDSVAREDAQFIARHDPARVLREVEADRQLLFKYQIGLALLPGKYKLGYCEAIEEVLAIRAARFRDHPDYDKSWTPDPLAGQIAGTARA